MLVRFFPNKQGGGVGSVYYLLNDRVEQGTSKLLQGDKDLTLDIINSLNTKQKVTFGSLNFNERDLSEDTKKKIMADFEKALLPDFQGRYNILWVQHTDKANLELNFIIPRVDLATQKALNPYYHKADVYRIDAFKELTNLTYNLTDPNDPAKKQTIQGSRKQKKKFENVKKLDEILQEATKQGLISNREELLKYVESVGIEVTRKGKDFISVKLPNSKRATRLKGSIYHERFTSIDSLRGEVKRAEEATREYRAEHNKANTELIAELSGRLEKSKQQKSKWLASRYTVGTGRDNQTATQNDKRQARQSNERDNRRVQSTNREAQRLAKLRYLRFIRGRDSVRNFTLLQTRNLRQFREMASSERLENDRRAQEISTTELRAGAGQNLDGQAEQNNNNRDREIKADDQLRERITKLTRERESRERPTIRAINDKLVKSYETTKRSFIHRINDIKQALRADYEAITRATKQRQDQQATRRVTRDFKNGIAGRFQQLATSYRTKLTRTFEAITRTLVKTAETRQRSTKNVVRRRILKRAKRSRGQGISR